MRFKSNPTALIKSILLYSFLKDVDVICGCVILFQSNRCNIKAANKNISSFLRGSATFQVHTNPSDLYLFSKRLISSNALLPLFTKRQIFL